MPRTNRKIVATYEIERESPGFGVHHLHIGLQCSLGPSNNKIKGETTLDTYFTSIERLPAVVKRVAV